MTQDKLEKIFKYWLDGAKTDLLSAKDIAQKAKRYSHALFFVHLSIEKILKAYCIKSLKKHAPFGHNLISLANTAQLELSLGQQKFLAKINEFNLEARYPEDLCQWRKQVNQKFCKNYLTWAEGFHQWILENLKNMP
ncbi:MAG: HEPN domain-containing protein [Pseudomonadota bacterium]